MTIKTTKYFFSRKELGFTLTELMISLVLGLFLTGAVLQFYMANKQTSRNQDNMGGMQEGARFALEMMARDVREAGFFGCASNPDAIKGLGTDGVADGVLPSPLPYIESYLNSKTDWKFNFEQPISGFEASGTAPGNTFVVTAYGQKASASDLIKSTNLKSLIGSDLINLGKYGVAKGSDVLMINALSGSSVYTGLTPISADGKKVNLSRKLSDAERSELAGQIIYMSDCNQSGVFQISSVTDTDPSTALVASSGAPGNQEKPTKEGVNAAWRFGTAITRAKRVVYFIGTGSGDELSTLYRAELMPDADGSTNLTMKATPLLNGVESLQVLYAVKNPTGTYDLRGYVTADKIDDFTNVSGVQVSMLVRSSDDNVGEVDDTSSYSLAGTTINPVDSKVLRRVYSQTLTVRNRRL